MGKQLGMVDSPVIILCFVSYYLPGYRSGGPIRTIANFADQLGDEFDIWIVCRDRDELDTEAYPNVVIDGWNKVGKAHVFYASEKMLRWQGIRRLLRDTQYDILYLNSFFSNVFTILPLLIRRLGLAPAKPCVLAPRGEFSNGAIEMKIVKKRLFVWLASRVGLYRNIYWQASSEYELADIRREFGVLVDMIYTAPNLVPAVDLNRQTIPNRREGPLRVIFLSRISRMKNLDFLLRVLARVSEPVEFGLYGPSNEKTYWKECQFLIQQLPENISVRVHGEVPHDRVKSVFAEYDLFALPTRGENFGHVILESLSAGTPVLISDCTPWRDSGDNAIITLPINNIDDWAVVVGRLATLDSNALMSYRQFAFRYAQNYLGSKIELQKNRQLFQTLKRCD